MVWIAEDAARHGAVVGIAIDEMMKAMMLDITTFSPVANEKREGAHASHRVGGRVDWLIDMPLSTFHTDGCPWASNEGSGVD